MKLLKSYVAFEVPHKIVKQFNLVLCIGDVLNYLLPKKSSYGRFTTAHFSKASGSNNSQQNFVHSYAIWNIDFDTDTAT
jgi:hypothetical protein